MEPPEDARSSSDACRKADPSAPTPESVARWDAFFAEPSQDFLNQLHHAEAHLQPVDPQQSDDWLAGIVREAIAEGEKERQAIAAAKNLSGEHFLQTIMGADFYAKYYRDPDGSGKGEGHNDVPQ